MLEIELRKESGYIESDCNIGCSAWFVVCRLGAGNGQGCT